MGAKRMKPNKLYQLGGYPIDLDTARILFPGEHYIPGNKIQVPMFDAPPPPASMLRKPWEEKPEDHTGKKLGRLTVVAYYGRGGGTEGAVKQKWVCRCTCGMYTIRTARTIKRAKDADDKCEYCRQLAYLKKADYYQQTGKNRE